MFSILRALSVLAMESETVTVAVTVCDYTLHACMDVVSGGCDSSQCV